MDPISITVAVIGAVCAMVNALGTIHGIKETRRKRRQEGHANNDGSSKELDAALQLSRDFNHVSSCLGRKLPSELDEKLAKELLAIRSDIQKLLDYLEDSKNTISLEPEKTPLLRDKDDKTFSNWQNEAMDLKDRVQKAIAKFNYRLDKRTGSHRRTDDASIPLDHRSAVNRPFCLGAIFCQNGASLQSIIADSDENQTVARWGFICQHCNLEVGDYTALRMKNTGTPLQMSGLLASCHLMACNPRDFRAFYRCLACHFDQKDVDFSTAVELEMHMDEHPDFSFLPQKFQYDGEKAVAKDIKEFLNCDVSVPIEISTESQDQGEISDVESTAEVSETQVSSYGDANSWDERSRMDVPPSPMQSPKAPALPPRHTQETTADVPELPATAATIRVELDAQSRNSVYELPGAKPQASDGDQ